MNLRKLLENFRGKLSEKNKTEKPFSLQDDEKEVKNMTKIAKFLNSTA